MAIVSALAQGDLPTRYSPDTAPGAKPTVVKVDEWGKGPNDCFWHIATQTDASGHKSERDALLKYGKIDTTGMTEEQKDNAAVGVLERLNGYPRREKPGDMTPSSTNPNFLPTGKSIVVIDVGAGTTASGTKAGYGVVAPGDNALSVASDPNVQHAVLTPAELANPQNYIDGDHKFSPDDKTELTLRRLYERNGLDWRKADKHANPQDPTDPDNPYAGPTVDMSKADGVAHADDPSDPDNYGIKAGDGTPVPSDPQDGGNYVNRGPGPFLGVPGQLINLAAAPNAGPPVPSKIINDDAQIVEDAFVNGDSAKAIKRYNDLTAGLPPDVKVKVLDKILSDPKIKLDKDGLKALGFSDDAAGALEKDSTGDGPGQYWDVPSYQHVYGVYLAEGGDPAKFVDWVNQVSQQPYGLSNVVNGADNLWDQGGRTEGHYVKGMNQWDQDANSGRSDYGHNWNSVVPQTLDGFAAMLKYTDLPDIPKA